MVNHITVYSKKTEHMAEHWQNSIFLLVSGSVNTFCFHGLVLLSSSLIKEAIIFQYITTQKIFLSFIFYYAAVVKQFLYLSHLFSGALIRASTILSRCAPRNEATPLDRKPAVNEVTTVYHQTCHISIIYCMYCKNNLMTWVFFLPSMGLTIYYCTVSLQTLWP
jgi:hypothetical protein